MSGTPFLLFDSNVAVGEDIILPNMIKYQNRKLVVWREDNILPYGIKSCFGLIEQGAGAFMNRTCTLFLSYINFTFTGLPSFLA